MVNVSVKIIKKGKESVEEVMGHGVCGSSSNPGLCTMHSSVRFAKLSE